MMAILLLQLAIAFLLLGSYYTLSGTDGVGRAGNPIGVDFTQYYSVSELILRGRPELAYDPAALFEVEAGNTSLEGWQHGWSYPPSALLLVWPLAAMPYGVALAAWLSATLALLLVFAYRTAPHPWTPILVLLYPAVGLSIFSGQNGCLSAALLAGGLALARDRPWLAGLCIGLLSYKPSLGLLIPVALIAGGHWRLFAASALGTILFALARLAAFGIEPWLAYPKSFPFMRWLLTNPETLFYSVSTPYAQAKLWGLSQGVADGAHLIGLAGAVVFVAWLWRGRVRFEVKAAGLILAIPFSSPYVQFYDMAIMAPGLLWLALAARDGGWLPGERWLALGAWIAAPAFWIIATATTLQLWPPLLVALLWLIARRRIAETRAAATAPASG